MFSFIETLSSYLNPKTVEAYCAFINFGGFIKIIFGACDMLHAALAARSIGVMQQAAMAACIFLSICMQSCSTLHAAPSGGMQLGE